MSEDFVSADIHHEHVSHKAQEKAHSGLNTKVIWRVFWILLLVTIFEVGISFSPLRVAKNFCPRALTRKGGIKVVIKAITIPIRITITAIVCSYEFMETKIGLHLIFLRFALCQATLYNIHWPSVLKLSIPVISHIFCQQYQYNTG